MPAYRDKKTNTWYCKFYYTDATGTKKQKLKRGFPRQREAKEWERNFLESKTLAINIKFKNFVEQYYKDMESRLKLSTLNTKKYVIDKKITPFFGELLLSDIKPVHIRQWQNELLSYIDENGDAYSQTYLRTMHNQLSAIFNYAVKYYELQENPCVKAGSIGKTHAQEMQIWTLSEFKQFIRATEDKPISYTAFHLLYYTGIRVGELLALTWDDIDFEHNIINIDKSYQRIGQEDIITAPKTPKSIRTIAIFPHLTEVLLAYKEIAHSCDNTNTMERIFPHTKHFFIHEMKRICQKADVKQIRVHDIRHSHVSLLIELGFSPLLIAERLGHENIETTLNTYSHLYPNKQTELAGKLQEIF